MRTADECPRWCEADHLDDLGRKGLRHLALLLDLDERIAIWVTRSDTWVGHVGPERVEVAVTRRDDSKRHIYWDASTARATADLMELIGADQISQALRRGADLIGTSPTERVPQAR
ncbi:hypothetical protein [Nocardiopsis sp. YSL2]|uniref:hypothetical protein n=1 Tax=Nocardiopsis sp. YSL2 TaxID=2939492 RepID=UPI0026F43028|nr:hypothetical protein [Nocardiopsis sp. YSL2]